MLPQKYYLSNVNIIKKFKNKFNNFKVINTFYPSFIKDTIEKNRKECIF